MRATEQVTADVVMPKNNKAAIKKKVKTRVKTEITNNIKICLNKCEESVDAAIEAFILGDDDEQSVATHFPLRISRLSIGASHTFGDTHGIARTILCDCNQTLEHLTDTKYRAIHSN